MNRERMHTADMDERINRRGLWLRIRTQLWWIPAAAVLGALVAAIFYMGLWLGLSGQRQYRQTSKYYLTFAADDAGNVQDYYNDYTWNDLIFSVPAISQVLESELSDGVTLEQAREDIEAQILSDVRVLTIQVTDKDPQTVQELTNGMQDALVRYGHTASQFESIEFLSSSEVEPVTVKDRSQGAIVLGALLGILISVAAIWLYELLNGGVYCPEEAADKYDLPVLFTLCDETAQKAGKLPDFLDKENEEAAKTLESTSVLVIAENDALAEETAARLCERYGIAAQGCPAAKVLAKEREALQETRLCLAVPYGKRNAAVTEHLYTQLTKKGNRLDGIVLTGADGSYLRKYYGRE